MQTRFAWRTGGTSKATRWSTLPPRGTCRGKWNIPHQSAQFRAPDLHRRHPPRAHGYPLDVHRLEIAPAVADDHVCKGDPVLAEHLVAVVLDEGGGEREQLAVQREHEVVLADGVGREEQAVCEEGGIFGGAGAVDGLEELCEEGRHWAGVGECVQAWSSQMYRGGRLASSCALCQGQPPGCTCMHAYARVCSCMHAWMHVCSHLLVLRCLLPERISIISTEHISTDSPPTLLQYNSTSHCHHKSPVSAPLLTLPILARTKL